NSSAYIRYPFNLADPSQVDKLTLRIQYDDAFAAYLNGVIVAWRNVPDDVMFDPLAFNDVASSYHADGAALQLENVDISIHIGALLPGANVLAIQGLNTSATNGDFLIRAAMDATTIGALSSEAGYFKKPTPGAANGLSSTDIGPVISKVGNTPAPPAQPTI